MAAGLSVISDLPKTLVYELARFINRRGRIIPERVLKKAPSAELRPDQRDSGTLPLYEQLDPILHAYIEEEQDPEELVAAGFDLELVARVVGAVERMEFKRWQMAPGLKVTSKAFGSGRRLPIAAHIRLHPRPGGVFPRPDRGRHRCGHARSLGRWALAARRGGEMIGEIAVVPQVEGPAREPIAKLLAEIADPRLRYDVGALGTCVEGELDAILGAVRAIESRLGAQGVQRAVIELRLQLEPYPESLERQVEGIGLTRGGTP